MSRPDPPSLAAALDADAMRVTLETLVRQRHGTDARLGELRVEAIDRRIVLYTLDLGGGTGGQRWQVVGKIYETIDLARAGFDALRRLWDAGFDDQADDGIHVPEAHACDAEHALVLMQPVLAPGLRTLLKQRSADADTVRLFARATRKLHDCDAATGEPFGVDDYLAQRSPMTPEEVAADHPDLAGTIRDLLGRVRHWHASLPADELATCHGDYHLGQAHVAPPSLWILDVDRLHRGDPIHDLAMVFADLRRLERKPERVDELRRLLTEFLATYFADRDVSCAGRVGLYSALIHLKKAAKHNRWRAAPDWSERLRQQLANAVHCVSGAGDRPPRSLEDVMALYLECPAKV